MRHNQKRVTIDLDDALPTELLQAHFGLLDSGADVVESRVSSGGGGFHVRAWFAEEDLTDDRLEVLRRTYGDDPKRIDLDDSHFLKPKQMLFTEKGENKAGPWHKDPWFTIREYGGVL